MNAPVRLAVDLGTTHTVAVVGREDTAPRSLLFDGSPMLASGVFLDPGGDLHTGRDAQRLAAAAPERFEAHPKRRIDDGAVLLGDREIPVEALLATSLRRVAEEAAATGRAPAHTILTCPADWGPVRRAVLERAAALAGLGGAALLPEPIAAATYCAEVLGQEAPVGGTVAVFDFGGGTFDTTVVRREADGSFRTLATGGLDDLGGLDVDMALAAHLGRIVAAKDPGLWRRLSEPADAAQLRERLAFWNEVRAAKEMLSRTSTAPVSLPGHDPMGLHLTRDELTSLADPLIARAVDETRRTVERAGLAPAELAAILLVGGSSRIPQVATRLHARLGVAPSVPEQPELPVAFGAFQHAAAATEAPAPAAPASPIDYAPHPPPSSADITRIELPPHRSDPPDPPQAPRASSSPPPAAVLPQQTPEEAEADGPARVSSPPRTPAGGLPPAEPAEPTRVYTTPRPVASRPRERRSARPALSSIVTIAVIVLVIALNRNEIGRFLSDLPGGDLLGGIGEALSGATFGTDFTVVHEQAVANPVMASVAVADDHAYIAEVVGGRTTVTALDTTGTALWTQDYELEPTSLGITVVGAVLLIDAFASATDAGQDMRAAVDTATGSLLWKQSWESRTDIAYYGTHALVEQRRGYDENAVIRLDLTTGEAAAHEDGPYDLPIIGDFRIRAESAWGDGADQPGTLVPNSYSLYDHLAATDRLVELAAAEATAVVRRASDGEALVEGSVAVDPALWTAFDGYAVGKVADQVSPGRAVITAWSLTDLAETWSVPFEAGYTIERVKPCGEHLVCVAVDHSSDYDQYKVIAFDTATGEQVWEHRSTDWSTEDAWYNAPGALLYGGQVFDTLDDAFRLDDEGVAAEGEPYSSVLAVRDGRALVEEIGFDGGSVHDLFVLDLATGDRTPAYDSGAERPEHAAVAGGLAAVLTGDGRAIVLTATGLD
ncbi:MAG TPA: Hsp70 family protein [Glycomyces sp.]|nr:Hsp70 family protein [Glycomyces sp.]